MYCESVTDARRTTSNLPLQIKFNATMMEFWDSPSSYIDSATELVLTFVANLVEKWTYSAVRPSCMCTCCMSRVQK
jgi:hypothetical protein